MAICDLAWSENLFHSYFSRDQCIKIEMIDKDMTSAFMQGGSVRPINNYQSNIMEPRSPHTAWQINPAQIAKHQPMEEDKNDSGVASGSDFHSSSPGSDTSSQDLQHAYHQSQTQNTQANRFYSPPTLPQAMAMFGMNPYSHNPLTPPNSEPLVSPKSEKEEKDLDTTLTPCASPNEVKNEEEDHLRRLQMTMEKNLHLSPRNGEHSMDAQSNKSDDADEYEEALRVPKVNSHGKLKTFKCKQCDFVANTKIDQWNHSKIHIREEKMLTCPRCPFVTEYKHHLEYHMRNHAGSKPFHCSKCDYSCVNKSMLNSHMKSHSNVYRFSCRDCNYATKYCHSLKLHLRRYEHNPSVVLDEEGNPCPDIIIDVYGTRRGPKVKSQPQPSETPTRPERHAFSLNPMLPQQLPFGNYPFFTGFPNPQILQQLIQERQALIASACASSPPPSAQAEPAEPDTKVLDLSKPGTSGLAQQHKNRRKGPAFRVDPSTVNDSEDDDDASTTMFDNVEVVQNLEEKKEEVACSENDASDNNNNKENKSCQYCKITFGDDVLYSIHMGIHGFHNPFVCNLCGQECTDRVSFFLHTIRASHS
ncbi:hypothetical protein Zmor_014064 [Zophobas morio]|uniref:Protein hunchback n=1 Tax=Zophobas morio TaxID=2755281 RepID=A0AA38IIX0_9CUCU|nr:hypothetical protein Zmor_014064 [Zophobas morio]